MSSFFELFGPVGFIFEIIGRYWWVWAAPVSVSLFLNVWVAYVRNLYKERISWTLLEIRMPREVQKTPKAMEQFFAALHGVRNAPADWIEYYWDGEVTLWFSLEVVSLGGEIHFYIRIPTRHKGVVLANLYANYPTVDVDEVKEDYINRFPPTLVGLYQKGMNLWGTELVLGNPDAYPIRTYSQFEHIEESMALDPIASLLEVFGKLNPKENVLLQMLVRPVGPEWKKEGEKIVDELKKKAQPASSDSPFVSRTPGEIEVLKAVEQNISKSGYETLVRYVYIADTRVYSENFAKLGTLTAFNQYSAQDLNYFRHNNKVYTQVKWIYFPYLFTKKRGEARKARLYQNFRMRRMPEESAMSKLLSAHFLHLNFAQRTFVLSTEELATLYHPPTQIVVTAPLLERVESKKLGPPAGLPIFEPPPEEE